MLRLQKDKGECQPQHVYNHTEGQLASNEQPGLLQKQNSTSFLTIPGQRPKRPSKTKPHKYHDAGLPLHVSRIDYPTSGHSPTRCPFHRAKSRKVQETRPGLRSQSHRGVTSTALHQWFCLTSMEQYGAALNAWSQPFKLRSKSQAPQRLFRISQSEIQRCQLWDTNLQLWQNSTIKLEVIVLEEACFGSTGSTDSHCFYFSHSFGRGSEIWISSNQL